MQAADSSHDIIGPGSCKKASGAWSQGSSCEEDGAGGQGHAGYHHLSRHRGLQGERGVLAEAGRGLVQEKGIPGVGQTCPVWVPMGKPLGTWATVAGKMRQLPSMAVGFILEAHSSAPVLPQRPACPSLQEHLEAHSPAAPPP